MKYMINKYIKKISRNINVLLLAIIITYVIIILLPSSIRFEYKKIEPTKSSFTSNEQISFVSTLEIHHESHLEYNDILFCNYFDERDANVYIANYITENIAPVSEGIYTTTRERHGELPKSSWLCYIRSLVCKRVLNVNKCQLYDGLENNNTFTFIKE